LQGVKAIGVGVDGRAQVSMNITDFHTTPMARVFSLVQELARNYGVVANQAELIGLIPQETYDPDAEWLRAIPAFDPQTKVLERRLEHPMAWPKG
jgi:glutamate formiminotransferase